MSADRLPKSVGQRRSALLILLIGVAYLLGVFILPLEIFLISTAFVLCSSVGLLGLLSVSRKGRMRNPLHVSVPRWVGGGAAAFGGVILLTIELSMLAVESIFYLGLIVFPGAYLLSLAQRYRIGGAAAPTLRIPIWLGTTALGFILVLAIARFVALFSAFELLLLSSMLMIIFYIGLIAPLGIWEIGTKNHAPRPQEPYPELSVVVPAYNEERTIERCLESIIASHYPDEKLEIIVIDDGSTDETAALAKSYSKHTVRVKSRPNGGRDAARNYGLFCANGEFLVMVDADSVIAPDALSIIAGALQTDENLGGVAGDIRVRNTSGFLTKIQAIEYVFSINTFRRACSFFDAVPIAPGALSGFRREALGDVFGFDPDTVTEDFDTTVKILDNGWDVKQVSALSFTTAPTTLSELYRQRIRWYTGGLQCIMKHRHVFSKSGSNYLQQFSLPFLALSYLFRPIVGVVASIAIIYGLLTTQNPFLLTGILYFIAVIGIVAIITLYLLDESVRLLPWYVFLLVGYKQFIDIVFIQSVLNYIRNPSEVTLEEQTTTSSERVRT